MKLHSLKTQGNVNKWAVKGTCSLYSLAAKSFLFPQYIAKTPLSLKLLYWMKPWAPGGEDHISHPESMCSWIPAPSITMVHKVLKIRLMNERNQWTCIYKLLWLWNVRLCLIKLAYDISVEYLGSNSCLVFESHPLFIFPCLFLFSWD